MNVRLIRSLVLVVALLVTPTAALAASDVTHFSFNGQSAIAAFEHVDASGCIVTRVGVIAVGGAIKTDGEPPVASETSILIDVNDQCTGETLVAASGSRALAGGDFIQRKLDTATLETSIDVSDKTSGSTFAVHLSLRWAGTGSVSRTKEHTEIIEPGFVFISRSDASSRDASASGTVSAETTNFTPDAAVSGSLADVRSGEVTILAG